MPFVEGAGVALHYELTGPDAGPSAVLVHGIAGDALGQGPAAARLTALGLRTVRYDRRGYGASGAPEPYVGTTVQEQAQDLVALLRRLDLAPALLVGDGFGALAVLDVAAREPGLVRGAVLRDPPLFALVPEANEPLAEQRVRLEDALRAGGPAAAVTEWLGAGVAADALARAQASSVGFLADYAGLASWPVSRAALRAIDVPVAVLVAPEASTELRLAAERLVALVPGAAAPHASPPAGELAMVLAALAD